MIFSSFRLKFIYETLYFEIFFIHSFVELNVCNFLRHILLTPDFRGSWDLINRVGGIKVGDPIKSAERRWRIPIICNVSGLERVTVPSTTLNSALVVRRVAHKLEGNKLYFSLILNAPSNDGPSAKCPDLFISDIDTGTYEVYYRDEESVNSIGSLTLKN